MIIFIYVLEALAGLQYLLRSCQAQFFLTHCFLKATSWETRQVRRMNPLSANMQDSIIYWNNQENPGCGLGCMLVTFWQVEFKQCCLSYDLSYIHFLIKGRFPSNVIINAVILKTLCYELRYSGNMEDVCWSRSGDFCLAIRDHDSVFAHGKVMYS